MNEESINDDLMLPKDILQPFSQYRRVLAVKFIANKQIKQANEKRMRQKKQI